MTLSFSRQRARWTVCVCLSWVALAAAQTQAPATWREARPLMGTLVEVHAEGADQDALRHATAAAYAEMERLTRMMSHYDADSTVSEINRRAGESAVAAPPELIEVLRMARRVSEATGGAFDVTIGALSAWRFDEEGAAVPNAATIAAQRALVNYRDVVIDESRGTVFLARRGMRLDLGGIAKLYILDAGMRVLERRGVRSAMINGGGDVIVTGAERGQPWRIGIRDPRRRDALLGVVELREGVVASSGDYERYIERDGRRYHHVLDPRTGRPAEGPIHVTLVAPRPELVNGYGPAFMILGTERARAMLERMPAVEALLVSEDGTRWATPALDRRLTSPPPRN